MDIQTYIIIWDVKILIIYKEYNVDILLPLSVLSLTEKGNTNWIGIDACSDKIEIRSNLSNSKEFIKCSTFVIDPATNTILEIYKGFETFTWNQNKWSENMRFVFELEMLCSSSPDPQIKWKRFTTEIKPPVNTKKLLLSLESEICTHTVLNNQGVSCEVKRYPTADTNCSHPHCFRIIPEKPSKNWNLLTVMLRQLDNNVLKWHYLHTLETVRTHTIVDYWKGKCLQKCDPVIIYQIKELNTSVNKMSESDIAAIRNVIKPSVNAKEEIKQHQNISSKLMNLFLTNRLCDITIHVKDQKIRTHKIVLATGSTIWNDLFIENETLATINIADFEYETIKEMIEFFYTGIAKQANDQLLMAADKYGVSALKEICETQLIRTINLKTVVHLLMLADRYKAAELFVKVIEFIQENYEAFKELKEAKEMFMMCPELGFKVFAKIRASRKIPVLFWILSYWLVMVLLCAYSNFYF